MGRQHWFSILAQLFPVCFFFRNPFAGFLLISPVMKAGIVDAGRFALAAGHYFVGISDIYLATDGGLSLPHLFDHPRGGPLFLFFCDEMCRRRQCK
jgi:hypothetical protein